jgi:hypothetical protein
VDAALASFQFPWLSAVVEYPLCYGADHSNIAETILLFQVKGMLHPKSGDGRSQLLRCWEVDRLKRLTHCLERGEKLELCRLNRFGYGLWQEVGHGGGKSVGIHLGGWAAGETVEPCR